MVTSGRLRDEASFMVGKRAVGGEAPCLLIAEVAQAHDGSLGIAHSFIDAVADAGGDAIKFQTHIAAAESTRDEPFCTAFSYEDDSRYSYWQRMEFSSSEWAGLLQHASERGIIFLSSVFSIEAAEMMDRVGLPAWKIGSGEVNNTSLLSYLTGSKKPILLSTGMSGWAEITSAVELIRNAGSPLAVLQCTSRYPTDLAEVGLNVVEELRERFGVPTGLSDHSGTVFPSLAAMARGAHLVEVHVTFHRTMFGPDVPASVTFEELQHLVQARDAFHTMRSHVVDKDDIITDLADMRALFNKSVSLTADQPAGTVLSHAMLTSKKPGTGIPADELERCVGKTLKRDVTADRLLSWEDLE